MSVIDFHLIRLRIYGIVSFNLEYRSETHRVIVYSEIVRIAIALWIS